MGSMMAIVQQRQPITVVIPTLNEAHWIRGAVESVAAGASEVIVVDGGSADATVGEAASAGARVIVASRGRGSQMQAGAREAIGESLVFLHADTRLEVGWCEALHALEARFVGGAFRFRLDSPRARYRLIEVAVRLRCAAFRLPYGDQALFARRAAFVECGGFTDVPILEDVDLVRRLRRCGPLAFPAARAVTSARRWEEHGFVRTTLRNGLVVALWSAGFPRTRLARLYGARG
jgi:rSAM/selenodomain-associated transferase 2